MTMTHLKCKRCKTIQRIPFILIDESRLTMVCRICATRIIRKLTKRIADECHPYSSMKEKEAIKLVIKEILL